MLSKIWKKMFILLFLNFSMNIINISNNCGYITNYVSIMKLPISKI